MSNRFCWSQLALCLLVAGLLSGCGQPEPTASGTPLPSPTISPLFQTAPSVTITPRVTPVGPPPTLAPRPPALPTREPQERVIFDDELASGWTLELSANMEFGITSAITFAGQSALEVVPTNDFGQLLFAVTDEIRPLLRDEVIGVTLRISGGPEILPNDLLTIAMQGSNRLPFYDPEDRSVPWVLSEEDGRPVTPFSETRLFFLEINRDVDAEEWVEVYVPLDDLLFDPEYRYFVGFYLKNDEGFRDPFYLDEVRIILR